MIDLLPTLNAVLNSTAAILLLIGRRFIARGDRVRHKQVMISAFTVSVLFLVSYLTYHTFHLTTQFQGQGWIRPVYFIILGTHTVCAAAVVPLVIVTLRRGLALSVEAHRKIARWTYPVWLYVSVTGVIVYLLLYHLYRP